MMLIWGNYLSIDIEEVIRDLRAASDREIFTKIRPLRKDIFVTCPNWDGHGGGEERTPSLSISRETGMFNCFGCGIKGDLATLAYISLDLESKAAGYKWLARKYRLYRSPNTRPKLEIKDRRQNKRSYLDESILKPFLKDHPYMYRRGLTPNVIDLFELGYNSKTNSIVIPMRDHKDRLVFIKERSLSNNSFRKYRVSYGVDAKELVYGLNIVNRFRGRVEELFLVEGEFDCLACYVAKKFSVALQGNIPSDSQIKQILKVIRKPIVLFLDNPKIDPAGKQGMIKTVEKLRGLVPLYRAIYPREVKDPSELTPEEIANIEKVPIF